MVTDKMPAKPCIHIYIIPHTGDEQKLREVKAGMEEEGIPCTVVQAQASNVIALSYQGASASQLGVGVGIGPEGMSIHYHKLPPQEPLFISAAEGNPEQWRNFGYNAARLVKGIPFKKVVESTCHQPSEKDEIEHLVHNEVMRILEDTKKTMGR